MGEAAGALQIEEDLRTSRPVALHQLVSRLSLLLLSDLTRGGRRRIVAPFVMTAVAWATLPEASLDRERRGVLLVGVGPYLHPGPGHSVAN